MRYLGCILSLLCVLFSSGCNTVYKGRIVSATTGLPLKDIAITTQNYDCAPAIVVTAITDSNGNFELELPALLRKYGNKQITVSIYNDSFQYADFQINKSDKDVVLKLKPKP